MFTAQSLFASRYASLKYASALVTSITGRRVAPNHDERSRQTSMNPLSAEHQRETELEIILGIDINISLQTLQLLLFYQQTRMISDERRPFRQ